MQRYDRTRFFAFGLLPTLNSIALLIYGLGLSTSSTGGAAASLPALIVLAVAGLLVAMIAAVKRARDLGWSAGVTLVGFWVALALGPVLLILIGYLMFAKSKPTADTFGPPAPLVTAITWYWAAMTLILPWLALAFLSKLL